MLRSGRVTAIEESRTFCVRLPEAEMLRPMSGKFFEKLTALVRVLCVYERGLYMLSKFFRS